MIEEMRYALKKMNDKRDERKKLYYFSRIHGLIPNFWKDC